MWLNYINQINHFKNLSLNSYIEKYSTEFSIPLFDLNKTQLELINSSYDLFPERKTVVNFFNHGNNLTLLLSIFKHWNELDWTWLFIDKDFCPIEDALNKNSPFYIYKLIGFKSEILLSEDIKERTLTFLFLFFLPISNTKPNPLLYQNETNSPLITLNHITFSHFNMLIFLMKQEDINFNELYLNYNFNHMLIDNFISQHEYLFSFQEDIIWQSILPLEKIYVLFNYNLGFNSYSEYINKSISEQFPDLIFSLIYIEKEYFHQKLSLNLEINKYEHSISKI